MNWTQEANDKLIQYLSRDGYWIPAGLGTKESACSVQAINLALTGESTYEIPKCMSYPLGQWIIKVQDTMPGEMRNSAEWKALLPLAAGTGREREDERLEIILDWMWGTVLPYAESVADKCGFGEKWRRMCEERTKESARVASRAAYGRQCHLCRQCRPCRLLCLLCRRCRCRRCRLLCRQSRCPCRTIKRSRCLASF